MRFARHPSETYYKLKPLPVCKTYPVYHPDREPKGSFEWPQRQEPQLAFKPSKLTSNQIGYEPAKLSSMRQRISRRRHRHTIARGSRRYSRHSQRLGAWPHTRTSHQAIIRGLAFKWIRILYRCSQSHTLSGNPVLSRPRSPLTNHSHSCRNRVEKDARIVESRSA